MPGAAATLRVALRSVAATVADAVVVVAIKQVALLCAAAAATAVAIAPRASADQSAEDDLLPSARAMKHSPMHQDFELGANLKATLANLASLPVEFRFAQVSYAHCI